MRATAARTPTSVPTPAREKRRMACQPEPPCPRPDPPSRRRSTDETGLSCNRRVTEESVRVLQVIFFVVISAASPAFPADQFATSPDHRSGHRQRAAQLVSSRSPPRATLQAIFAPTERKGGTPEKHRPVHPDGPDKTCRDAPGTRRNISAWEVERLFWP